MSVMEDSSGLEDRNAQALKITHLLTPYTSNPKLQVCFETSFFVTIFFGVGPIKKGEQFWWGKPSGKKKVR